MLHCRYNIWGWELYLLENGRALLGLILNQNTIWLPKYIMVVRQVMLFFGTDIISEIRKPFKKPDLLIFNKE